MSDVQRAGGVGGDELHHHAFATADVETSERIRRLEDREQPTSLKTRIEPKIEKARAGDFRCGHSDTRLVHRRDERFGDVARLSAERLGEHHREIGGPVAERRITRPFENRRNVVGRTEGARCARKLGAQGVGVSHKIRDVEKRGAVQGRIQSADDEDGALPDGFDSLLRSALLSLLLSAFVSLLLSAFVSLLLSAFVSLLGALSADGDVAPAR